MGGNKLSAKVFFKVNYSFKHVDLDRVNICRLTQADAFIAESWANES